MLRVAMLLWSSLLFLQSGEAQDRLIKQEVNSRFLGGSRTVRVYLPASYTKASGQRYPVLYLHDGQNVYSFAGTNIAFGWGSWELDKTVDQLAGAGQMPEVIMVAVDNSRARYAEYCGAHHTGTNQNTPFENYSAFLLEELKPKIDAEYRTEPKPATTAVMGSSMGGICSLILAWEHPDVFGAAASLSGAFMVEHTNFLDHVLRPCTAAPKPIRVYLDCGITDFMGGDDGRTLTDAVAGELKRLGWQSVEPAKASSASELKGASAQGLAELPKSGGASLLMHYVDTKPLTPAELEKAGLRQDKRAEAQTSQHNEFYWRLRAWRALTFLFPPTAR
jgi:predicted alpha/beta superfamily hydrolase